MEVPKKNQENRFLLMLNIRILSIQNAWKRYSYRDKI